MKLFKVRIISKKLPFIAAFFVVPLLVVGFQNMSPARPPHQAVHFDFDGDGKSDLLWVNAQSGQVSIWPSGNSANAYSQGPLDLTVGETIVQVGDYDGDGKADFLTENMRTGLLSVWPGGNSNLVYPLGFLYAGYALVGSGDFWGSGKAAPLLYNNQTGSVLAYPSYFLGYVVPTAGWTIAGVGDFDGDGKADILWQNTLSGAMMIWGAGMPGNEIDLSAVGNPGWNLVGIADFDGDGKDEILWFNRESGALSIWPGAQAANHYTPGFVVSGAGWNVNQLGDFNGNHKADVLWSNSQTGQLLDWTDAVPSTFSPGTVSPASGWALKSNVNLPSNNQAGNSSFSQDWTHVESQILQATNSFEAIAIGQNAGLSLVIADGAGLSSAEFFATLNDPVTGNFVASVSQSADVQFINIPPNLTAATPYPNGHTSLDPSYVCMNNGAPEYVAIVTQNGQAVPVLMSVLTAQTTSINITYLPPDPLDLADTNDPAGILKGTFAQPTTGLASSLGLPITTSISPDSDTYPHPTPSSSVAQITVTCSSPQTTPAGDNMGGWAGVIMTESGAKVGHIVMVCSLYSDAASLSQAIYHEILHTFGASHDAGNDAMNYATTYGTGKSVLPSGEKNAVQAQMGSAVNVIDFSKCQTTAQYHAIQCASSFALYNTGFEFGCTRATPPTTGNSGSPSVPTPVAQPTTSPSCYNTMACNPPLIYDTDTCNCYIVTGVKSTLYGACSNTCPDGQFADPTRSCACLVSTGKPVISPFPFPIPSGDVPVDSPTTSPTLEPVPIETYNPPPVELPTGGGASNGGTVDSPTDPSDKVD